jgi:hypothetical protein
MDLAHRVQVEAAGVLDAASGKDGVLFRPCRPFEYRDESGNGQE